MLIDARAILKGTKVGADICIIGAGAAGITLAREFIGTPFKVCLLESGGFEIDGDTQSLYDGVNVGKNYFPLDIARLRYFGGTTNHWDGACIPFDEIDFQVREWVPYSGWPITLDQLESYYRRAQVVCEVGPYDYSAEAWGRDDRPPVVLKSRRLINKIIQVSPTRFGEKYREEIIKSANIDTFLHANVLEIETNENVNSVSQVKVASLEKNTFLVNARIFILATGGIENARLLLLSDSVQKNGIGNQNDLVGRFFQEHPVRETGYFLPTQFNPKFYGWYTRRYDDRGGEGEVLVSGYIKPPAQVMVEEAILNCGITLALTNLSKISAGVASMREVYQAIKKGELPEDFVTHLSNLIEDIDDVALASRRKLGGEQPTIFQLGYFSEQSPNPNSRVSLQPEVDVLGKRKVRLDWRLNDIDKHTYSRLHEVFAEEMGRVGLGRLRVEDDAEAGFSMLRGSYHHIGTTRMHDDPKQGVVDKSCCVHGIDNLYIAGSSVFSTGAHANPTLTIVALALRLADHVKGTVT